VGARHLLHAFVSLNCMQDLVGTLLAAARALVCIRMAQIQCGG
jgi:hypothetical protein